MNPILCRVLELTADGGDDDGDGVPNNNSVNFSTPLIPLKILYYIVPGSVDAREVHFFHESRVMELLPCNCLCMLQARPRTNVRPLYPVILVILCKAKSKPFQVQQ